MNRVIYLVLGISIGVVAGIIVTYSFVGGEISRLQSANDKIVNDTTVLEAEYTKLKSDFEDLKNQQLIFQREAKTLPEGGSGKIRVINVTASQWKFTPDRIEVDLGDIVILRIRSVMDQDMNFHEHGFALNDWYINQILPENTLNTVIFVADKPGEFFFWCSVYCGVDHNDMFGTLIINEP
jgi:heme/copper-type cytochrome/quinol oxidase subunit 2